MIKLMLPCVADCVSSDTGVGGGIGLSLVEHESDSGGSSTEKVMSVAVSLDWPECTDLMCWERLSLRVALNTQSSALHLYLLVPTVCRALKCRRRSARSPKSLGQL